MASIREMSQHYCETCKEETLHIRMACNHCKTEAITAQVWESTFNYNRKNHNQAQSRIRREKELLKMLDSLEGA